MVVAVVLAVLVLALGLGIRYAFITSPDQAAEKRAPRIADSTFEHAASAVCKQYVQVFNTETTLSKQPTAAESGAFLDSIASSFDEMVGKLRALPVTPAAAPAVSAWLGQWDAYDAFGHQYAAAVRTGSERDLIRNDSSRIGAIRRDRNAFANVNHMSACAFN